MTDTQPDFVAPDFPIPPPPATGQFVLAPLEVHHNQGDLAAWSSSVDHIHRTPGFEGHPWPDEPMTLDRNRKDMQGHVDDRQRRQGFTYTVLAVPGDDIVGCVYIYPSTETGVAADVRSWVRADRAELDAPLYWAVMDWLREDWPFDKIHYAAREPLTG
jgi:hypothetical protein